MSREMEEDGVSPQPMHRLKPITADRAPRRLNSWKYSSEYPCISMLDPLAATPTDPEAIQYRLSEVIGSEYSTSCVLIVGLQHELKMNIKKQADRSMINKTKICSIKKKKMSVVKL